MVAAIAEDPTRTFQALEGCQVPLQKEDVGQNCTPQPSTVMFIHGGQEDQESDGCI